MTTENGISIAGGGQGGGQGESNAIGPGVATRLTSNFPELFRVSFFSGTSGEQEPGNDGRFFTTQQRLVE